MNPTRPESLPEQRMAREISDNDQGCQRWNASIAS